MQIDAAKAVRNRAVTSQFGAAMWNCFAPTYQSWRGMKKRCLNQSNPSFKYYGAKGIKICDRWLSSFENFLSDMGERPNGKTLDRIDNSRGYDPSNCIWSSPKDQCRNRSSTSLTIEIAREIRFRGASGITHFEIAKLFSTDIGTVSKIRSYKLWKEDTAGIPNW